MAHAREKLTFGRISRIRLFFGRLQSRREFAERLHRHLVLYILNAQQLVGPSQFGSAFPNVQLQLVVGLEQEDLRPVPLGDVGSRPDDVFDSALRIQKSRI